MTPSDLVVTEEYMTGLDADVHLPEQLGTVPLVVMVPGGPWVAADRTGLDPLAEQLATDGIAVVNATHRPASADVLFPVPVQDVLCSVGFAVERLKSAGRDQGQLVLLGHSSGAHLAALAVLAPERFRGDCAYPPVAPEAMSFSHSFADALETAGHPVHVEIVPGAGHHEIYGPDAIGDPLSTWILSLS